MEKENDHNYNWIFILIATLWLVDVVMFYSCSSNAGQPKVRQVNVYNCSELSNRGNIVGLDGGCAKEKDVRASLNSYNNDPAVKAINGCKKASWVNQIRTSMHNFFNEDQKEFIK